MTITTYTPAEFAVAFPRAAAHPDATAFVAVMHHPKARATAIDAASAFGNVIRVGGTNISGTKTLTRFAVLPTAE